MRSLICLMIAAGALVGPAAAESLADRVHADSFGNLVIDSAAGYKRIIVGQGEVADAYNLTGSYYEPEDPQVVYLDRPIDDRSALRCSREGHVWHGRSHMYGLSRGEAAMAPLVCR